MAWGEIKDKTKIKTIITLKKVGKEEVARKAEIILYAACDNMNVVNEKAELLKKEGYNVLFTASSPLGKMDISQIRYFPAFENEAMKIGDLLTTQFIPIEDPLVKGINVYLGCGYIK
jgi:HEAT repeat protein